MDKVLVHQAWSTLDVLVFGLLITALVEVCLRGLREYQYAPLPTGSTSSSACAWCSTCLPCPALFQEPPGGAIVTRVQELNTIREF